MATSASPSQPDPHELRMALEQAIRTNDMPRFQHLLAQGAHRANQSPGQTSLMTAAIFHRHEMCEALILAGADIHALDINGIDAIHHASGQAPSNACIKTCEVLLRHGADPHGTVKSTGNTCLHLAANEDNADLCALLIARGALIDEPNLENHTPLSVAVKTQSLQAARGLLKAGADPDWWPDKDRKRSLVRQAEYLDDFPLMWTLIAYGAICQKDVEGDFKHVDQMEASVLAGDFERFAELLAKQGLSPQRNQELRQVAESKGGPQSEEFLALLDATLARQSIAEIVSMAKAAGADPERKGAMP